MDLWIGGIRKENSTPTTQINMHDIALLLVMFGQFLLIVFQPFKWCHIVQNGQFSGLNYV